MRVHHIVLIAVAASPGLAQCVEQIGTELAPVSLSMRVNPDGALSGVACGPTVAPTLCPMLSKAVSRWKFAPGQRDSAPAAIDIWLTLDLVAIRKSEGFSIQATRAAVFPRSAADGEIKPETRFLNPPIYPKEEMRRRKGAVVIMELSPQPGSPHPLIGQAWVGGKPARPGDPFVQATRIAVAKWELAALLAEQLSTCVSVEFTLSAPKPTAGRPPLDTAPCVSRYRDGFVLPKLLTDPLTAAF